jgi:hypothetical protein
MLWLGTKAKSTYTSLLLVEHSIYDAKKIYLFYLIQKSYLSLQVNTTHTHL